MAELKERLRADLTVAMKAQDKLTTATLQDAAGGDPGRGGVGQAGRANCPTTTYSRCWRASRASAARPPRSTCTNGRGELAANERAEAQVIDDYLPTQLNDDELANVVDTAMAQVAEEIGQRPGTKQMGQVMKAATAIAEGKADSVASVGRGEGPPVAGFRAAIPG